MLSAFPLFRPHAIPAPKATPSAFELDLPPHDLPALLAAFVDPAIVVRCGGISLFRKGRPGAVATTSPAKPLFSFGEETPLSIDPGAIRRICLIHDAAGHPSLEVEFSPGGFALSIGCGSCPEDARTLRDLLARIPSHPLPWAALKLAGAAAWLDDFPPTSPFPGRSRFLFDRETREVSLSLALPGLSASVTFLPTFIDRDGTTLRLASRGGDRVIHVRADAADIPFLATSHDSPRPRT